ncbi:MAG: lipid-A-disaccharide synthase [Cyanobacteria bacterium P01_G01_bin.19]
MSNAQSKVDIVILSNGPGEIATWVRPVVKCLARKARGDRQNRRISVLLSPCPHSTGKEAKIVSSYPGVDRVLPAEEFFNFLLWGKTPENWQWHSRGTVVFLGGDQFYAVVASQRLGYRSLIYAEWDARWYRFIDRFAAMSQKAVDKVPAAYRHKLMVVGDLMADTVLEVQERPRDSNLSDSNLLTVGLLVGSKPAKLAQGVPLCLAIAEKIHQHLPQVEFIIPVAPTIDLATLEKYARQQDNPLISLMGGVGGEIVVVDDFPYLVTFGGIKIKLITRSPAYQDLIRCQLCLTTVGANTAELASLGIPMIVLLPTQQLDAMRSWDGLPGILANLPGIGTLLAKLINWLVLRQGRLFAWPNIWAGTEIVPELVGELQPSKVAELAIDYLTHPSKLQGMKANLLEVRGKSGAAQRIADIIEDTAM